MIFSIIDSIVIFIIKIHAVVPNSTTTMVVSLDVQITSTYYGLGQGVPSMKASTSFRGRIGLPMDTDCERWRRI